MHTPILLSALFTATTLALPRPQAFWTGIPSVYIPSHYPGCTGGMPCPESFMRDAEQRKKPHPSTPSKRQQAPQQASPADSQAGVFSCKDIAWAGECQHRISPLGSAPEDCTALSLGTSSLGPDQGFYCIFYTNALCAPLASDGRDTLTLTYPGTADLRTTEKGDFNDRLLSYQCFREEGVR